MTALRISGLLLIGTALLSGNLCAQSASGSDFVLRSNVDEVEVRLFASDSKGAPVSDLKPGDIEILQDRRLNAPIKSFTPVTRPAFQLGVLLDRSESTAKELQAQVASADDLVTDLMTDPRDRAFVLEFATHSKLLQGFTNDPAAVRSAIQVQQPPKQRLTSLFDALVQVCSQEFSKNPELPNSRRMLLLFSDGLDNLSIHSVGDAIAAARAENVAIYAVAPEYADQAGLTMLRTLAERTGGRLELIRKPHEVNQLVASIMVEPRGSYALSFQPPDRRPGFHSIELRSSTRPDIVFKAREDFYVGP